jgi:hypothetical protein
MVKALFNLSGKFWSDMARLNGMFFKGLDFGNTFPQGSAGKGEAG